ncbi:hypothetical protein GBAR_LOCUS19545 [Geodia barretti]|uniref:Uncharacterized protein n=1 Tax=Geodia barretti TaxID=519541 RepID=A0AA35SR75_GEOBA|nr:hypothetical protein GBAR_LOCUS19545 [Geodia barretti]
MRPHVATSEACRGVGGLSGGQIPRLRGGCGHLAGPGRPHHRARNRAGARRAGDFWRTRQRRDDLAAGVRAATG